MPDLAKFILIKQKRAEEKQFRPRIALPRLAFWVLLSLATAQFAHALDWTDPAALNANASGDAGDDASPQLTTDEAGTWIALWRSNDSLGGTIGTDDDILFACSSDNGVNWSAPAALNSDAAIDGANSNDWPQLTSDRAGNWIAVWGGGFEADWDIHTAHSSDNGASWSTVVALNSNASSDSGMDGYPQLTTDQAGNWIAVWTSEDSLGGTIGTDFDILYARSTDNGATWSSPAALNSNAATDSLTDYMPQLTTDLNGIWVAVWYSNETLGGTIGTDYDILYARSTDNGVSWSSPTALNSNAGSDSGGDYMPQLTTDQMGNWVALWFSTDALSGSIGVDEDILYARSTDNGATWSAPTPLNSNAGSDSGVDYWPQLSVDRNGNWIGLWYSSDSLGGTIGWDWDILFSHSIDNGASWSAPAALNSNAESDTGSDRNPQLTTDGAWDWIAVWDSTENLGGTIGIDKDITFSRNATSVPVRFSHFRLD